MSLASYVSNFKILGGGVALNFGPIVGEIFFFALDFLNISWRMNVENKLDQILPRFQSGYIFFSQFKNGLILCLHASVP